MSPGRLRLELEMKGRTVSLGERTLVMGIVNVTPDSFSDGGRYFDADRAIEHGIRLATSGADWIDVGGESSRPGATPVSAAEELRRVLPVIRKLHRKLPRVPISIDTTKAAVAEQALEAGASVVNDVSGLRFDPDLAQVVLRHRAALILMHQRGNPRSMQRLPFARSVTHSVENGLTRAIRHALAAEIPRQRLIIDPGLGFGKSRRQSFELLGRLPTLRQFRLPILVGASRKSFVQAMVAGEKLDGGKFKGRGKSYWALARLPEGENDALDFGDAAAVTAAILGGAHIVRVHNVAMALAAARVADAILATSRRACKAVG